MHLLQGLAAGDVAGERARRDRDGIRTLAREDHTMPIYALGKLEPALPEVGRFWIAPDAHVIGNVRLDLMSGFGSVPSCVGTTNLLSSANAAMSRKARCCTSTPAFRSRSGPT